MCCGARGQISMVLIRAETIRNSGGSINKEEQRMFEQKPQLEVFSLFNENWKEYTKNRHGEIKGTYTVEKLQLMIPIEGSSEPSKIIAGHVKEQVLHAVGHRGLWTNMDRVAHYKDRWGAC